MNSRWFGISFVLFLGACAVIPKTDKTNLLNAIDCTDPEAEIATLENMKPNGFKRTMTALQYVSPAGLIGGAVNDDFSDRNKIINGKYTTEIDQKISRIRSACNIPATKG